MNTLTIIIQTAGGTYSRTLVYDSQAEAQNAQTEIIKQIDQLQIEQISEDTNAE